MNVLFFSTIPGLVVDERARKVRCTPELRDRLLSLRAHVPQSWSELHMGGYPEQWDSGALTYRPDQDSWALAKALNLNPQVAKLSDVFMTDLNSRKLRVYLGALPERSIVIADALLLSRLTHQPVRDGEVVSAELTRAMPVLSTRK